METPVSSGRPQKLSKFSTSMSHARRYIIVFIFLLGATKAAAQLDLTGTWEGIMGRQFFPVTLEGQLLQLNIIQNNGRLCGYTFDSVINHKGAHDYCKALFEGKYDKKMDLWVLTGTSFIENSGNHVLMRIRIWNERRAGKDKLEAELSLKSDPDQTFSVRDFFNNPFGIFDNARPIPATENLRLKRVSADPPKMPANVPSCFSQVQKTKDSLNNARHPPDKNIAEDRLPIKPADSTRSKIDSLKNLSYFIPIAIQNDTPLILQRMTDRKKITFSHLPVDVKHITLKVYDNAIIDDDTVTIFYNNRLLVNKQRISEKPITIEIDLDEKEPRHEIILFADNLGSIPPNTALIVVTAGDKRYEIHSSASLQENAVLVFDYVPK